MTNSILLMPFLDESGSFTNGFECGKLWEKMTESVSVEEQLIHSENIEQIKLMCEHFGYEATFQDCEDGCWHYLTCKPIEYFKIWLA